MNKIDWKSNTGLNITVTVLIILVAAAITVWAAMGTADAEEVETYFPEISPTMTGIWGSTEREAEGWNFHFPREDEIAAQAGFFYSYHRNTGKQVWVIASGRDADGTMLAYMPSKAVLGAPVGRIGVDAFDDRLFVTYKFYTGQGSHAGVSAFCDVVTPLPEGQGCVYTEQYFRITQPVAEEVE